MSATGSRLAGLVAAARSLSRRDWLVFVGAAGVLSIGVIAVFAPILAPYPADVAVGDPFEAPSSAHPLGTDDAGHDLLSLLLVGARVSLLVGLLAGSLAVLAGLFVGVTAGVVGGRTETVLMRVVDVVLTLPFLPLVIVAAAVLGPSLATTVGVLVAVMWARPARELRSQVLSIRARTFVRASRSMGASPTYVARHYVVPALLPIAVAQFAKAASSAILLEASLSFLGLGDPTAPSWGTILFYAQQRSAFLTDAWSWWVLPPGVAIGGSVLSFTFLALGIERRTAGDRRAATAVDDGPELTVMPPAPDSAPVLDVTDLTVVYGDDDTAPTAVDDVNLSVGRGETLGVVGESGSGKSSLALALLALLDPPGRVASGSVTLRTDRIDDAGAARSPTMADFRGDAVAFVPQEAMNALDPRRTLREQVVGAVLAHRDCSRADARERAEDVLTSVGLDAESHGRYPHELSGGMRQRGVIAAALANDPDVLVADEPTTGLDTVTTIRLLDLLESLQARLGFSLVMVTHDLSSVARVADRIAVVRDGRVVEVGETDRLHESPDHPYTNELLGARPTLPSDIGASRVPSETPLHPRTRLSQARATPTSNTTALRSRTTATRCFGGYTSASAAANRSRWSVRVGRERARSAAWPPDSSPPTRGPSPSRVGRSRRGPRPTARRSGGRSTICFRTPTPRCRRTERSGASFVSRSTSTTSASRPTATPACSTRFPTWASRRPKTTRGGDPPRSPGASGSASPSPAPSFSNRRSSSPTSPPRCWTRRSAATSWNCCTTSSRLETSRCFT
ncbi:glutathione import ATP-binding protein GsiA [Haloferax sp. BAB-2207]|nr:glutathione import ATP-binding protein GsiA [Haloferax sp. BAB-2207]